MPARLDLLMFHALNGVAGRSIPVDSLFVFGAKHAIYLMGALLVAYVVVSWGTDRFEERFEHFVSAAVAGAIGYVSENLIGFIWFRPRPFAVLSDAVKLIEKSGLEKSFPSGHATIAFSLAFSVFLRNRTWGFPLMALAVFVGVSRVVVGVHYPSDVLGGAVLGCLAAAVAAPAKRRIEPYLDLFAFFRNGKRKERTS